MFDSPTLVASGVSAITPFAPFFWSATAVVATDKIAHKAFPKFATAVHCVGLAAIVAISFLYATPSEYIPSVLSPASFAPAFQQAIDYAFQHITSLQGLMIGGAAFGFYIRHKTVLPMVCVGFSVAYAYVALSKI